MTRLFIAALGIFLLSLAAVADASTVQYRYDELDRLYRAEYGDGTVVEYVYDNVGNRMDQRLVDITPPVTTATPPGGQYGTGVTISLSCSDGPGGSGCDKIYYTVDGTIPSTASPVYSSPLPIAAGGTILKYFAVDRAGNTEAVKTQNYVIATRTIAASAGAGGSISPTGNVTVNYGASQTFTITPNAGYAISDVVVDNTSRGALPTYTFDNVTTNHTISATFAAASVNLALNKTATASSTRTGTSYTAAKAVDGSATTSWMSSTTSSAQWVRVDLGGSMTIAYIKVAWPATYYAKRFDIQTSPDGSTWTTRYTTPADATGTPTSVAFAPVSARYVWVNCTTRNNSSYYGVSELEVYATAPPNQAPVANAGPDKTGVAGTAISFTGSGTDSDGTIVGYSWNWGDGTANTNTQNASHTYAAAGTYTATLTVSDNLGSTGTDTAVVTVSPAPPVNLALNKTATASTQRSGSYTPAKAVDGSTTTSWMSSTTSSAQWVRVDLGGSFTFSNIKVTWPATYFAKRFDIQTSTDGSTWTTRYTTTSDATGALTNVTFAPVSARYVRVNCTTRNNSSYYGVSELEVYP